MEQKYIKRPKKKLTDNTTCSIQQTPHASEPDNHTLSFLHYPSLSSAEQLSQTSSRASKPEEYQPSIIVYGAEGKIIDAPLNAYALATQSARGIPENRGGSGRGLSRENEDVSANMAMAMGILDDLKSQKYKELYEKHSDIFLRFEEKMKSTENSIFTNGGRTTQRWMSSRDKELYIDKFFIHEVNGGEVCSRYIFHREYPSSVFTNDYEGMKEGGHSLTQFQWVMSFNTRRPMLPVYADDIVKYQHGLICKGGDNYKGLPMEIVRWGVSNQKTLGLISGLSGKELHDVFLNETPNGKSTQRIMNAVGLRAGSVFVNYDEDESTPDIIVKVKRTRRASFS
ncbi:hypothetical protein [Serratia marcescens]|uniref:hypothetical protein n=1 Tax=Serratia marcescens TaxID=615 RepID=UPI0027E4ED91|nr:hypothetical protein [Serratia marcescens]MCS3414694.1 hypothetical protein [Serratia marcescens]BEN27451.1 hypothetical protein SMKC032_35460 [Serratia marcescens]